MPEPTGRGSREFLPSANQALAARAEGGAATSARSNCPSICSDVTLRDLSTESGGGPIFLSPGLS